MNRSRRLPYRLAAEPLEQRVLFAIELDIVALHEFGHSLGLAHYADTAANSLMEAYYNPSYNKANLATDVAVTANASDGFANLLELFSDAAVAANSTSWKDTLDGNPNGVVNVTYSYMPDGNKLDSNKRNNIFATLNAKFGSPAVWQGMLGGELDRWASVSTGNLSFGQVSDNGANMGVSGAAQNDARFGDIRIGSHRFDGPGGVLAHAYYPLPNGGTTAGDAHFASEESWINGDARSTVGSFVRQADGRYYCPVGEHGDHHDHGSGEPVASAGLAGGFVTLFDGRVADPLSEGVLLGSGADVSRLLGSEPADDLLGA